MAEHRSINDQGIRQQLESAMQQWERVAEGQIQHFHTRLDGLLAEHQHRFVDMTWQQRDTPYIPHERDTMGEQRDAFDTALHDMRDDRREYQEANVLAMLDRQLERMQHRDAEQGQHR